MAYSNIGPPIGERGLTLLQLLPLSDDLSTSIVHNPYVVIFGDFASPPRRFVNLAVKSTTTPPF